jgi:hypothetical protein
MSLQQFINSAQSIEFARAETVANSVSRSGRVIAQTRNSVKPWQFKVVPAAYLKWSTNRAAIEAVLKADRATEQTISLGATAGSSWLTDYQGGVGVTSGVLDDITVTSASGNSLTIDVSDIADGTVIFQPGDLIQPVDHRYPYTVTAQVLKATGVDTATVPLHRGYIAQSGYTLGGKAIKVGPACTFRVLATTLPGVRYLPGQLVEFTSEMQLLEVVV